MRDEANKEVVTALLRTAETRVFDKDTFRQARELMREAAALLTRAAHEPGTLRAPIDGPFEVWFKPDDGSRGVKDDRNGISLTVHGFVDQAEHYKYCVELANTLNARSTQPPEVIPDRLQEAGWLVERGNIIPEYAFFDKTGCFGWTSDANAAMRFARRVDANMFAAANDEAWRIVEHMWVKYDEQPTSTKCERQNTGGDAGSQARWDQGGGAGDSSFGETRPAELCSKCHSSRPCACQLAGGHFSTALGEGPAL